SIISLLISILLPALGAAREAARGIQCLSNIRQLTLAITQYQFDYNDYVLPYSPEYSSGNRPFWYSVAISEGYVTWGEEQATLILPVNGNPAKDPGIPFRCPS